MHKSIDLCDVLGPEYLQEIENFIAEWESQSDFIEVQTSGSTGNPKRILLKKEHVRASAIATGKFFDFQAGQSILLNLSPHYIAGKLMIVRALIHDMRIVLAPLGKNPLLQFDLDEIDFGAFVPYQIHAILADAKTSASYAKIKNVIIGGAPLAADWKEKLGLLSNSSYNTFGMTETITHFALQHISNKEDFYTCLPGFRIEKDDRGCLILQENEITDRLVTNDLIELMNDHQFKWLGRLDFVINSGGIKISPEQVEFKLAHLFQSQAYFIHGRASAIFGQEVVMYIEGEESSNAPILQVDLSTILSPYERPKAIVFVPVFERTSTGKILRKNYR